MEGSGKKVSFRRDRKPELRARNCKTFYDSSTDSLFVDMLDADGGLSYVASIDEHLAARLDADGRVLGFILRSITVLAQRCELSIATRSKRVAVAGRPHAAAS